MSIRPRSLSIGSLLVLGACFSPGGQLTDATSDATATATTSTTTTATTSTSTTATMTATATSGTTTGEPTTTLAAAAASTDGSTGGICGDCAPPTPYCAPTGDCIDCAALPDHGMSCADLDPQKPLCDQSTDQAKGQCVACVMNGDCAEGQTCDPDAHTCVECSNDLDCPKDPKQYCVGGICGSCVTHDDCASGACEVDIHKCFPPDASHWYAAAALMCDNAKCTELAPCCEISQAMTAAIAAAGTHHIIHVMAGGYTQPFTVDTESRRIAVIGQANVKLDMKASGIQFGKADLLPGDSKLYLSRLALTGGGTDALHCENAAFLGLDEVTVTDFVGDALSAEKCTVWARRSQFLRNVGGLHVSGTTARLENTVISGTVLNPALQVEKVSQVEVIYTTLGRQNGLMSRLLGCTDINGMMPGTIYLRNSAVLASDGPTPIDCMAIILPSNSVTTNLPDFPPAPPDFKSMPANEVSGSFLDWPASDLRVSGNAGYLVDVAQWVFGDPAVDLEGQPRPMQTPDFAGADRPGGP
jgi:hypothetical protein